MYSTDTAGRRRHLNCGIYWKGVLLRHFCFKQSQINNSGMQAMQQLAVSVFPNSLENQMSKKRCIQGEGRTYKTSTKSSVVLI